MLGNNIRKSQLATQKQAKPFKSLSRFAFATRGADRSTAVPRPRPFARMEGCTKPVKPHDSVDRRRTARNRVAAHRPTGAEYAAVEARAGPSRAEPTASIGGSGAERSATAAAALCCVRSGSQSVSCLLLRRRGSAGGPRQDQREHAQEPRARDTRVSQYDRIRVSAHARCGTHSMHRRATAALGTRPLDFGGFLRHIVNC